MYAVYVAETGTKRGADHSKGQGEGEDKGRTHKAAQGNYNNNIISCATNKWSVMCKQRANNIVAH